jgi:hypothetical protein
MHPLPWNYRETSGQLHSSSILFPETPVPINYKPAYILQLVWMLRKREKFWPQPGIEL